MNADTAKKRIPSGLTLVLALSLAAVAASALWFTGNRQSMDKVYATTVRKAQIVAGMRADLYAAAEAEKSAVLADTDQASQEFAARARAAVDKVAAGLADFRGLAEPSSTEADLAGRFEEAFAEYRKVDAEVLELAVQNTNLKALALSFGAAAAALGEMEQALRPALDAPAARPASQALRALSEALRIQALHSPHINEKTEARMDALEKDMTTADRAVRAALAALGGDAAARALAAYDRYWAVTGEILALSRRNTNVRSLSLSLSRKTRVLAACDEALGVLEHDVRERMASKATR